MLTLHPTSVLFRLVPLSQTIPICIWTTPIKLDFGTFDWFLTNLLSITPGVPPKDYLFFYLCIFCLSGSLYPYPVWGSPYQSADHHWPMYNITNGSVEDVEGAAHTIVHNGAKIIQVPQLGHALSLDGKDDWVDTGKCNMFLLTHPPSPSRAPSPIFVQSTFKTTVPKQLKILDSALRRR